MYRRLGIVYLFALLAAGCGGYASESGCPFGPNGKCQGSRVTYQEAVYGRARNNNDEGTAGETQAASGSEDGKMPLHLYQLTGKTSIGPKSNNPKDPDTLQRAQEFPSPALMPLKTPGRNMRIWLSDYIAGATVVTEHYLIFEVEKPEFVIGRKIPAGMNEPTANKDGENR